MIQEHVIPSQVDQLEPGRYIHVDAHGFLTDLLWPALHPLREHRHISSKHPC